MSGKSRHLGLEKKLLTENWGKVYEQEESRELNKMGRLRIDKKIKVSI